MSAENVELVRRLQPRPEADLAVIFRDQEAFAAAEAALAPFFHPDCEVAAELGTLGSYRLHTGFHGLRDTWLEWLEPWASYRSEIERLIDVGDRVVVLVRDFGRREEGGPEVAMTTGAIWTVCEGRISAVVFYVRREDALRAAGLV